MTAVRKRIPSRRGTTYIKHSNTHPQVGVYMSYKPSLEQIDLNQFLNNDSKNISKIVLRLYKWCGYVATQYLVSDKMAIYFNVLNPLMAIGLEAMCRAT
jgi:hypothetical protein